MAYDLAVQGLADFHRLDNVLARRRVARDPLSGVVDGTNVSFFTSYAPIYSGGSIIVYIGQSPIAGTVDTETGEITTGSAPTQQPVATYTFTPYTVTDQLSFLINGFQHMEGMWHRGFLLLDQAGAPANEQSSVLYVDDGNGGDPFTGRTSQLAFFMACVRYAYLLTQLTGSALTDYQWRETVRGMNVDRAKRPGNIALAVKTQEDYLKQVMSIAQNDWYKDGSNIGSFVASPATWEYVQGMQWQQDAITSESRAQLGNHRFLDLTT